MRSRTAFLLAIGLLGLAILACGLGGGQPTGTPLVQQLMPDMPGYKIVEGAKVQEYITKLAEGAALLSLNPEMILLIEKVDSTITCYEEVGAASMRIYSDEDNPLSSGAVAIADRKRLTDPQTLFRCIGKDLNPFSGQATLDPCAQSYTLERDDSTFSIVYIGTTREICQAFCSELEGCSTP